VRTLKAGSDLNSYNMKHKGILLNLK